MTGPILLAPNPALDISVPACVKCGGTSHDLECELRILLLASSDDPAGPFRREAAVDSVHTVNFYCHGCGKRATGRIEKALLAMYRGQSADRGFDPAQGNLLAQFGVETDIVHVRTPALVRWPANCGAMPRKRGR